MRFERQVVSTSPWKAASFRLGMHQVPLLSLVLGHIKSVHVYRSTHCTNAVFVRSLLTSNEFLSIRPSSYVIALISRRACS